MDIKRIYVSTVGRGKQKEESSKVYCLDFNTGKILGSVRLPLAMFDLANPRGGCRGARGLSFLDTSFYAAGFDGIFEINPDTMFVKRGWWTPEGNGIHQVYPDKNKLIYVATRHNSIWSFVPTTGKFKEVVNLTNVHQGINRPPEEGSKDTVHFNSMCGDFALFAEVGAIVHWPSGTVVLEDKKYHGSHDLVRLPGNKMAMNHSRQRKVVVFDMNTWEETEELLSLPYKEYIPGNISISGFTRGMFYIESYDLLLVGSAPASIYGISNISKKENERKINKIKIVDEICESVFDVIPHPKDWK